MRCFKGQKVAPGQRIFGQSEKMDTFCLILKGKVGIFYPEAAQVKEA